MYQLIRSYTFRNLTIETRGGQHQDVLQFSTSSNCFRRFMKGCQPRMRHFYKPNLVLNVHLIVQLLDDMKNTMHIVASNEEIFDICVFGTYVEC